MTRRSDMMLEDLAGCTHEPETPVVEEDGQEILYWLCRCGRRHEVPAKPNTSHGVFDAESSFESALYKDKK